MAIRHSEQGLGHWWTPAEVRYLLFLIIAIMHTTKANQSRRIGIWQPLWNSQEDKFSDCMKNTPWRIRKPFRTNLRRSGIPEGGSGQSKRK